MAATGRRTGSPLTQLLFEKGFQFDFFQAVRLLERAFPESEPVARTSDPGREVVRFRSRASLGFPPSQIHEVRKNGSEGKASPESEMTVAFMGLTGPVGVLPVQYTELIMERARYRDETLWTFL